jgi:hypothetical protein
MTRKTPALSEKLAEKDLIGFDTSAWGDGAARPGPAAKTLPKVGIKNVIATEMIVVAPDERQGPVVEGADYDYGIWTASPEQTSTGTAGEAPAALGDEPRD